MPSAPNRRQFTALLLSAAPAALFADTPQTAAGRTLELRIGDGFGAGEADIRAVLVSAAESIWKHCPDTRWEVPGFSIYHSGD